MDNQTCFSLFILLVLVLGYRFVNTHWPSIWTGGVWTIRGIFFLILIGMLLLGGVTGEEVILALVWSAFEFTNGKVKPKPKSE